MLLVFNMLMQFYRTLTLICYSQFVHHLSMPQKTQAVAVVIRKLEVPTHLASLTEVLC
jgi:hypothetical protein